MKRRYISTLLVGVLISGNALDCHAKSLFYHATKKALAKKIRAKGFSVGKMKAKSRFGKGVYLSGSPKTAKMERKGADAIIRVKSRKGLKQNSINLTKPSARKIRSHIKVKDMRGGVKKGIVGPKIGRRLGKYAGEQNRAIRYRSAKNPKGTNYFIPRKLVEKQPNVIRKPQIKTGGYYQ